MNDEKNMNCIAFIFARGGSKGIPRKNIREFCGHPLIAYSIKIAQQCPSIDRVVVSTDDLEIARVAREYGAEVPFMRPPELAEDTSSEIEAWKHAVLEYQKILQENIHIFVSLPPTSPLRSVDDVEQCIQLFKSKNPDIVVTVKEASRSPYFNMLKNDPDGYSTLVNASSEKAHYCRRQDVPQVYDMTTVAYVSRPDFILKTDSIFSGKMRSVIVPDERAVDIDTLLDFKFAEFLMNTKDD